MYSSFYFLNDDPRSKEKLISRINLLYQEYLESNKFVYDKSEAEIKADAISKQNSTFSMVEHILCLKSNWSIPKKLSSNLTLIAVEEQLFDSNQELTIEEMIQNGIQLWLYIERNSKTSGLFFFIFFIFHFTNFFLINFIVTVSAKLFVLPSRLMPQLANKKINSYRPWLQHFLVKVFSTTHHKFNQDIQINEEPGLIIKNLPSHRFSSNEFHQINLCQVIANSLHYLYEEAIIHNIAVTMYGFAEPVSRKVKLL